MKTHPHNANPETYAAAIKAAEALRAAAKEASHAAYGAIFSTIEATEARADAIELNRAAEGLRDAVERFTRAACRAEDNAEARAAVLAEIEQAAQPIETIRLSGRMITIDTKRDAVEGRDDEDRVKPLPPRVANREARQAYAAAKAAGTLPPASQPNEIPEIGENP